MSKLQEVFTRWGATEIYHYKLVDLGLYTLCGKEKYHPVVVGMPRGRCCKLCFDRACWMIEKGYLKEGDLT